MFTIATSLLGLTFENFHVTKENRLAHAAALAVAEKPGTDYNPFFLHSASESGATDMHHLLAAIGNRIESLHPEKTVLYVTGKAIAEELARQTAMFGKADVLLLESLQDMSEALRENVQSILEHFTAEGRQLVISSNLPPKELPILDFSMATQMSVGMVVGIEGTNETA